MCPDHRRQPLSAIVAGLGITAAILTIYWQGLLPLLAPEADDRDPQVGVEYWLGPSAGWIDSCNDDPGGWFCKSTPQRYQQMGTVLLSGPWETRTRFLDASEAVQYFSQSMNPDRELCITRICGDAAAGRSHDSGVEYLFFEAAIYLVIDVPGDSVPLSDVEVQWHEFRAPGGEIASFLELFNGLESGHTATSTRVGDLGPDRGFLLPIAAVAFAQAIGWDSVEGPPTPVLPHGDFARLPISLTYTTPSGKERKIALRPPAEVLTAVYDLGAGGWYEVGG